MAPTQLAPLTPPASPHPPQNPSLPHPAPTPPSQPRRSWTVPNGPNHVVTVEEYIDNSTPTSPVAPYRHPPLTTAPPTNALIVFGSVPLQVPPFTISHISATFTTSTPSPATHHPNLLPPPPPPDPPIPCLPTCSPRYKQKRSGLPILPRNLVGPGPSLRPPRLRAPHPLPHQALTLRATTRPRHRFLNPPWAHSTRPPTARHRRPPTTLGAQPNVLRRPSEAHTCRQPNPTGASPRL